MKDLISWWDLSIIEGRKKVKGTKETFLDLCAWLHKKRKELKSQGQRIDLFPNGKKFTWLHFLSEIGLPKTTAYNWLSQYDPKTNTIKDIEAPIKKKKIEPPAREPVKIKTPVINDQEYERRKKAEMTEEETTRPLDEIFEDVQKVIVRQENEEVFREFDLDALIDELRRRIVSISDPSRRHHSINQIIKAMR